MVLLPPRSTRTATLVPDTTRFRSTTPRAGAARSAPREKEPLMANVYYEKDADRSLIAGRKVAVIGYGSQGHAHALNLKESGVDVRVGLREGSSSVAQAEAAGLRVLSVADATAEADLVILLGPDTEHKATFNEPNAPHLPSGPPLSPPPAP